MPEHKPEVIIKYQNELQDAYALDEDTASVILSATIAAVMGPGFQVLAPDGSKIPTVPNLLALEPRGLPRYAPVIDHLFNAVYEEQLFKLKLRQNLDPETLVTLNMIQNHHTVKAEEKLAAAKYNDYSPKPRPRGFEAEDDNETPEAILAKKMLVDQREKKASSIWALRPMLLSRSISSEAVSVWRKLSLDQRLHLFGPMESVMGEINRSKPEERRRILRLVTGADEIVYGNAGQNAEVPMHISFFLTLPPAGPDGLYLPGLDGDFDLLKQSAMVLPPLDQALVSPGKFNAEASGFNRVLFNRLVGRILDGSYRRMIGDDTWQVYQKRRLEVIERCETVSHPLLRATMLHAPDTALQIAGLWDIWVTKNHRVPAQVYEEVWAMLDRLMARLDKHLRECPAVSVGPDLSPETQKMVEKLKTKGGSATHRNLTRSYSKMSRDRLDVLVAEAKAAGRVKVKGQTITLVEDDRRQMTPVSDVSGVGDVTTVNQGDSDSSTQNPAIEERQNDVA